MGRGRLTIKDDSGADRFIVDGRAFSIGNKLSLQDAAGRELIFIREKVLSWGPTYELQRAGGPAATVKKDLWTFFKDRFTVDATSDGPTPDDLEVRGDFWDHEYAFARGGNTVATVSKRWFSWADTYGVDVAAGQDECADPGVYGRRRPVDRETGARVKGCLRNTGPPLR